MSLDTEATTLKCDLCSALIYPEHERFGRIMFGAWVVDQDGWVEEDSVNYARDFCEKCRGKATGVFS